MTVRTPAVAGMFYPSNSRQLQADVDSYLAGCDSSSANKPLALVLPHAGYIYSASVAAKGYSMLAKHKDQIRRVVLLGPSHRVALRGIATPSVDEFSTPLGNIAVDKQCLAAIEEYPGVTCRDDAHELEHSLEVHLPFLQRALGEFLLVPLVVGDASPEDVSALLESFINDEHSVIIISSDLSHFLPYDVASEVDARTADKIVQKSFDIHGEEACGCRPLNGLLHLAKSHNLDCQLLGLKNSGDTAGDRDRVVGYGAFALFPGN
jgi:AmmeMemoRadiSam system protein B